MIKDTRREALDGQSAAPHIRLHGLRLVRAFAALSSTSLVVAMLPGEAVLDDHVQALDGRTLTAYAGETLADGYEIWASVVVYYLPATDEVYVAIVDGDVALADAGEAPDDATLEAALPSADAVYSVAGSVRFVRSGSAVTSEVHHISRSFDVDPDRKETASNEVAGDVGLYKPWGVLSWYMTAADVTNGNLITAYPLPLIHGRIRAMRSVVVHTLDSSGGSATALLNAEINGTNVTGGVVTLTEDDAKGTVKPGTAITAANTFAPGATVDIEAASVTAFDNGGGIMIELDIDELVA